MLVNIKLFFSEVVKLEPKRKEGKILDLSPILPPSSSNHSSESQPNSDSNSPLGMYVEKVALFNINQMLFNL